MVYCYQYVHVRNKDFGIRTVEQLFLHPRGVQWHTHIQFKTEHRYMNTVCTPYAHRMDRTDREGEAEESVSVLPQVVGIFVAGETVTFDDLLYTGEGEVGRLGAPSNLHAHAQA